MAKIHRVSDDGQLIEHLTTEEVKAIARDRRANASRSSAITLEERNRCFGSRRLSARLFQLR